MAFTLQSGADSTVATVDSTSKALRVSPYDVRGNFTGQKATYTASTAIKTAIPTGTTPFFYICGSATKTIRVQKITVCATVATTAVYGDLILYKRTSNGTFGTSTALTGFAHDSSSAGTTATNIRIVTAGSPTAGGGGGSIASQYKLVPVTGTPVLLDPFVFDYQARTESEALVLRGTAEGLELAWATTLANTTTVTIMVTYTEE